MKSFIGNNVLVNRTMPGELKIVPLAVPLIWYYLTHFIISNQCLNFFHFWRPSTHRGQKKDFLTQEFEQSEEHLNAASALCS